MAFPSSHSRTYKLEMQTNAMLVLPTNELQRVKNILFLIEKKKKKKSPKQKNRPMFCKKNGKKESENPP